MHASLVCRLDVLETWGNCLQGTQKVPIHDMRLWPCMAQFRMDLWECRADGRVIECPTQKARAWDLNQHQSLSLRLKDRNMCFPTESACMPHQLKRTWSSVHCTVIHVAVAVSLVPSCIHIKYCLLAWDLRLPHTTIHSYAWNISCLDLPPGEKRMYSQGIKSHQFCCFQSVSWGGASRGGRINFRCAMQKWV
jgi:hypothetical protein